MPLQSMQQQHEEAGSSIEGEVFEAVLPSMMLCEKGVWGGSKEMPLMEFEETTLMSQCSLTTLTLRGGGARSNDLPLGGVSVDWSPT